MKSHSPCYPSRWGGGSGYKWLVHKFFSKDWNFLKLLNLLAQVSNTGPFMVLLIQWSHHENTPLWFNPCKSHFYVVKLGFTGVNSIFAQKHRLFILVQPPQRGTSNEYTQSRLRAEIWKEWNISLCYFHVNNFLTTSEIISFFPLSKIKISSQVPKCWLFIWKMFLFSILIHCSFSMKSLYTFNPYKPHIYKVTLGFAVLYIIVFIFAQKHRPWVLIRAT